MKQTPMKHGVMGALLSSVLGALLIAGTGATAGAAPQRQAASQPATAVSSTTTPPGPGAPSFVFRDTPIAELFEMISRHERLNIMLGKGVSGNVAVSLYDMTPRQAIFAIAEAGGYQVLVRENGYMIVNPADSAGAAV